MDKLKLKEAMIKKAKTWTNEELIEKIDIVRKTQLDMLLTFQGKDDHKGVKIGEEQLEIFINELKNRDVDYDGKTEDFLKTYYELASTIAKDYNEFNKILEIIREGGK